MIGALIENLFDAFLRPRRSVRRLIDGGYGIDTALLMVLLGLVLREIFILITPGARMFEGAMPLAGYMVDLIEAYVTFGLMVMAIYHLGRMFGGVGDLPGTAIAVAWYLLVMTVFTPLVVPASVAFIEAVRAATENPEMPPAVPGGAMMVLATSSAVSVWLLAAYVAELHRFERIWNVLLVMIGLFAGISIMAVTLLQNL